VQEDQNYNEILEAELKDNGEMIKWEDMSMEDIFLEGLSSLGEADYKEVISEFDSIAWIETNRTIKGRPFSFDKRNYLLDIYRDESRHLIIYKGRQVEMTEFAINWCLWKLWKHPYTAALHTFPRDKQVLRVSKQRIQPAIKDSKKLTAWKSPESDQRMIKFEKMANPDTGLIPYNFLVMGGTWEGAGGEAGDAARGLTIDFTVYDERQDHPNDVEAVVGEAMSHSEFKKSLTLGTPKLPGTQFDEEWESSTKQFWMNTCEHCGMVQTMTMENILKCDEHKIELIIAGEDQEYYYGCRRCFKPINRVDGFWKETNPQRRAPYSGYHISQLIVSWISAQEIMDKYISVKYTKRKFFNEVLGLAYGGDDIPITQEAMNKLYKNDYGLYDHENEKLYVGIDWGKTSWIWVQKKTENGIQPIMIDYCDDKRTNKHASIFAQKLKPYAQYIKCVVNDAGPDITRHQTLGEELVKIGIHAPVYACYYAQPPAKVDTKFNDKEGIVSAGRSEYIEMVSKEIETEQLILPGKLKDTPIMTLVDTHFTCLSSERIKRDNGQEFIIYHNSGDDHLLHAKIYCNVAMMSDVDLQHVGSSASNFQNNNKANIQSTSNRSKDLYGLLKTTIKPKKQAANSVQFGRSNRRRGLR